MENKGGRISPISSRNGCEKVTASVVRDISPISVEREGGSCSTETTVHSSRESSLSPIERRRSSEPAIDIRNRQGAGRSNTEPEIVYLNLPQALNKRPPDDPEVVTLHLPPNLNSSLAHHSSILESSKQDAKSPQERSTGLRSSKTCVPIPTPLDSEEQIKSNRRFSGKLKMPKWSKSVEALLTRRGNSNSEYHEYNSSAPCSLVPLKLQRHSPRAHSLAALVSPRQRVSSKKRFEFHALSSNLLSSYLDCGAAVFIYCVLAADRWKQEAYLRAGNAAITSPLFVGFSLTTTGFALTLLCEFTATWFGWRNKHHVGPVDHQETT